MKKQKPTAKPKAKPKAKGPRALSLRTIPGVKVNGKYRDALAVLGPSTKPGGFAGMSWVIWPALGIEMTLIDKDTVIRSITVHFDQERFRQSLRARYRPAERDAATRAVASTWRTEEGIGAGSSIARITKAFGEPNKRKPNGYDEELEELIYKNTTLYVRDGKLEMIEMTKTYR